MLALGLILLLLGLLLPAWHILVTVGIIVGIVGLALLLVRPGGRTWY